MFASHCFVSGNRNYMGILAQYEWPQGNTHDQLSVALVRSDGTTVDLTGVPTTSVSLRRRTMNGSIFSAWTTCAGSVQAVQSPPSNGVFTYAFAQSDVALAGTYQLEVIINYGGPSNQLVTFPQSFVIISA